MKLPTPTLRVTTAIAATMALAAAGAVALTPTPQVQQAHAPLLSQTIPGSFGPWRLQARQDQQAALTDGTEAPGDPLYDQVVMRSYVNATTGQAVMLALAWGREQRQDVKVHRPEVCYPAQGFKMLAPPVDGTLLMQGQQGQPTPISVRSLVTQQGNQLETVRYWIRVGQRYGGDGLGTRLYLLREGLHGRVPDGILVRASQRLPLHADPQQSYAVLDQFLRDLTASVPAATRAMLVR